MADLIIGRLYHVEGWNYKAVFQLVKLYSDGNALLRTPKKHKTYVVASVRLFNTKKKTTRRV